MHGVLRTGDPPLCSPALLDPLLCFLFSGTPFHDDDNNNDDGGGDDDDDGDEADMRFFHNEELEAHPSIVTGESTPSYLLRG